jgi:hypothetical protein
VAQAASTSADDSNSNFLNMKTSQEGGDSTGSARLFLSLLVTAGPAVSLAELLTTMTDH